MLDRLEQRPVLLALLIGIAALLLFGIGVQRPSILMFDEVHYVPAARVLIDLAHPVNMEHPLLGKSLIALGMLIFGDNPIGWRAMSVLAGALTIVGVYSFARHLTGATRAGLFAALFAMLGQLVFIQARIGMLDVFLGMLLVWAGVAFLRAMQGDSRRRAQFLLLASAIALGGAVAVKWAAVPYVALAGMAFLWLRRGHPERFGGTSWFAGLTILGCVSIATYFLTFAPAFFYTTNPMTLARLVPFQLEMWGLQTQVLAPHNYQSDWWSWPLMLRPIWYFYEPDQGAQRGVLLIGNPAIMWGGAGRGRRLLVGRTARQGGRTADRGDPLDRLARRVGGDPQVARLLLLLLLARHHSVGRPRRRLPALCREGEAQRRMVSRAVRRAVRLFLPDPCRAGAAERAELRTLDLVPRLGLS